jgi:hypothetical protein
MKGPFANFLIFITLCLLMTTAIGNHRMEKKMEELKEILKESNSSLKKINEEIKGLALEKDSISIETH